MNIEEDVKKTEQGIEVDIDAMLDDVSDELAEMIDAFAGKLMDLAQAGQQILDRITEEMEEPDANIESYKALAEAVVHAVSGFEVAEEDEKKESYC